MTYRTNMNYKNNIFKSGTALLVSLLFFANVSQGKNLVTGMWRGYLQLNDSTELPFQFSVQQELEIYTVTFYNGSEKITTKDIRTKDDSLFIRMPVFDSEFKIGFSEKKMKGVWVNHARKEKNIIPFYGEPGSIWKENNADQKGPGNGRWEVTFSPNSKDSSKAIGIFYGNEQFISGTFLTETGDYRYLAGGSEEDGSKWLSCFDGAHAFLFTWKYKGDSIVNGHFYSGAHWEEPWVARRNDKFELRNPDSLTYLKPGYTGIDFSFKNTEGKDVSLKDDKFKNKVVIVQLMGTWCPNCMDETKFLAPFYDKYKPKGLEVVALAFERTDDFAKAVSNVSRSKSRFGANYEFLITMKTGNKQAAEALPMLNAVMAFPTTIFIDKKGRVRKIYTGFNGPATGDAYTKYVEETTLFVEKLLRE